MIVTRFHDLETIELEVEFLTPAFLGGADQNAELRCAPFKTGLRYWWRVLYGSRHKTHTELKAAEDAIFGSTDGGSNIRLSVVGTIPHPVTGGFPNGTKMTVISKGREMKVNILEYLSYGHYHYERGNGNIFDHSHITSGQNFKLIINVPQEILNEITGALKAFITYGGIGSRSRNGFGSLSSNSINTIGWKNDLVLATEPLEYPVLSRQSKLYISKNGFDSWEKALSEVGIAYKNARGSLENRHTYAKRGLIARPIEVRGESIPDNVRKGRHSKPFYLGIQKRNGKYFGQIFSLPIRFYENSSQKDYQNAIGIMHQVFTTAFSDETKNIISRMEVNP